jgi:hypothetical protein
MDKLYALRVDNGKVSKNGNALKDTTWHKSYDEVEHAKGFSKVGKGAVVEVQAPPIPLGDGVYANADTITDAELAKIKSDNVGRLVTPKFNEVLKGIKALAGRVSNNMVDLTDDQRKAIESHLLIEVQALQDKLYNVKQDKKANYVTL